jgi:dephospho-CoA kinase
MRVLGLTGGIGTGKSAVALQMTRLGAVIIDADEEGHQSYARGTMGWHRLVAMFGESLLRDDGEIDRRTLGQLVFGNPQALAWLNAAIHPLLRARITDRLEELRAQDAAVAVVDAAVLYQAGWDDLTDEVWVVTAPDDAVIARLADQRDLQPTEARRRIAAQQQPRPVAERAEVVIENVGSMDDLKASVERAWSQRNLP